MKDPAFKLVQFSIFLQKEEYKFEALQRSTQTFQDPLVLDQTSVPQVPEVVQSDSSSTVYEVVCQVPEVQESASTIDEVVCKFMVVL